eukprot:TRINITY_DN2744_c0_g1_i2.p1 TRINITY_DN2744_c0_g1~~TRINITY_DN2744_c0_g1_i2.p1  ORF type:complete len:745 (+),score=305.73 TRINITY_DN2744_c0_g1_i2:43-2277(+)
MRPATKNNWDQLHVTKKPVLDPGGAKDKWTVVENAIHQIYQQNASTLSFQNLYSTAYTIVLHKHAEVLYAGVEETMTTHIVAEKTKVLQHPDSRFLQELLEQWDGHRTAVSMIRDILMYMDKNYVPQCKKLGVYDLGVRIFGEHMLQDKKASERVQTLTLTIIHQERNGEMAPQRMLLKNLTKMMTEVSKQEVYEPCLEEPFLRDSREYYRLEASTFFAASTVPQYIRKVFKRLEEEADRVARCLDDSTRPKVEQVIRTEMITAYKQQLIEKEHSGCLSMLRDWKVDDLKLLYECLKQVDDVQSMVEVIKENLLETGVRFVQDTENNQLPMTIVEGLVELRDKYTELLERAFAVSHDGPKVIVDKTCELAITKAFEEIVNKNGRFPEYLSLFVDGKLRRTKAQPMRDEEYDAIFDKVLLLFRHLREKDVFEKYYKNHLAKRLLQQKSSSEEAERLFISKLKTEYGYQFTSKLEGMFQDIKLSQEKNEAYRQHCASLGHRPPLEMVTQVLTTTWWPLPSATPITLPFPVEESARHFKDFYLRQHSGRKLHYQFGMGNADLRLRTPTKVYELNVSTYQMVILLLYNAADGHTFGEIAAQTRIPVPDLRRALASLCHGNPKAHPALLLREAAPVEDQARYVYNADFRSKFVKVKVVQTVQKETEDEAKETRTKVDEDRKWQLDAVIVRVMKSRKAMEHRQLVMEAVELLKGRFQPSPEDIKKRIESLIEREYLERSPQSRSKYNYLA